MKAITLIVDGYKWKCPECEKLNHQAELTLQVTCDECGTEFIAPEIAHEH